MKNILFFLSHQPNPRFIKQIKYLSRKKNIYLSYFARSYMPDLNKHIINETSEIFIIGKINNRNYFLRIFVYISTFMKTFKYLMKRNYDSIIVNNLDTLIFIKLVLFFKNEKPMLILEISDLRSYKYRNTFYSRLIRLLDKIFIKKINRLILTSPNFANFYKNISTEKIFILENKILPNFLTEPNDITINNPNDKFRIGIVGLLLQTKAYIELVELIGNDSNYEIYIFGKGPAEDFFIDAQSKFNNIFFNGQYDFFYDIKKIHNSIDLLFLVYDVSDNNVNNFNAVPNKFYEAAFFKTPVITSKKTYLGNLVEKYGMGVTVEYNDKIRVKNALENIRLNKIKFYFDSINSDVYIGDNDYKKFEKFIE